MAFSISRYLFLCVLGLPVHGQSDSIKTEQNIEPVVLLVDALQSEVNSSTFSAIVLDAEELEQTRQLSLKEVLLHGPGIHSSNATNYAQDLRISIRGYGSRAAFGIRGIKLIADGISESTPDGTGQLDNIDLSQLDNIQVLRGASSIIYGNASGGVIQVNSKKIDNNNISVRSAIGSNSYRRLQAIVNKKSDKSAYSLSGNYSSTNGHRQHSAAESMQGRLRAQFILNSSSSLELDGQLTHSPYALDAGGVNETDYNTMPFEARGRNVLFQTGEAITHGKFGTKYLLDINENLRFSSSAFLSKRSFSGKLPFENGGAVDLSRLYVGIRPQLSREWLTNNTEQKIIGGVELASQIDDRSRFDNEEGRPGEQTLQQDESFSTLGLFALYSLSIDRIKLESGLRWDKNKTDIVDQLLSNGDTSGRVDYSTLSPGLGINFEVIDGHHAYINYGRGFETPALSEVSANPNAAVGFNDELLPQRSSSIDGGIKGHSRSAEYQLAIFHINTSDEIVSYEDLNSPGRNFYRNAGKTKRRGLEATVTRQFSANHVVKLTYNSSDISYDDYEVDGEDYSGNQLPGIPNSWGAFSYIHESDNGLRASIHTQYNGKLYADDENTTEVGDYFLVSLNTSWKLTIKDNELMPFFGISNLLNERYADNIRANAFGGRYFEAGPERQYYLGFRFNTIK